MKLSIVIPCKDDKKITECVASIDASVEVVIVFNGAKKQFISDVHGKLKRKSYLKIRYLELPKANLAWALEKGIWASTNDWVLLMDSDCIFEPGSVKSFHDEMSKSDPANEVYKGQVIFDRSGNLISRIIAKSRQHHTAEKLTAYKPPLSLSKTISKRIGGYFFHKKLIWREDADLDNRLRTADIQIKPVPRGVIHHGALTLRTDLRSTFRYGVGGAIAKSLNIKLTDVPRSFLSTLKSQGIVSALYMLFRNRFYTAGYYYQRFKDLKNRFVSPVEP